MASINDVTIGNDELDAAKMKPWWEVIVTYCNRLLFACSFVTLVLVDFREEIDAKCVPKVLNETENALSDQEEFIDMYCYNQLFLLARYPGVGGLMGTIVAYVLCMWWTSPCSMRNAFRALAKADDLLKDTRITQTDLRMHDLKTLPKAKKDAINFASKYLNKYINFHGKTLALIYVLAMFLRLVIFIFAIYMVTSTFFENISEAVDSYFECDAKLDIVATNLQFYCTSDIKLCGLVFGLCVFLIAVVMLFCSAYGAAISVIICNPPGLRYVCRCLKLERGSGYTHQGHNFVFLKRFCIDSTAVCPALMDLLNYVVKQGGKGLEFKEIKSLIVENTYAVSMESPMNYESGREELAAEIMNPTQLNCGGPI